MNDKIIKLKAEIFDLISAQDNLRVQIQSLENVKRQKAQELNQLLLEEQNQKKIKKKAKED